MIARLLAAERLRHSAVSLGLVLLCLMVDPYVGAETFYDDLAVWLDASRNTIGRRLHDLAGASLIELERACTERGKRYGPNTPYRVRFRSDLHAETSWRWMPLAETVPKVVPLLADARLGGKAAAVYLRAAAAADQHGRLLISRSQLPTILGLTAEAAAHHIHQLARFQAVKLAQTTTSPRLYSLSFSADLSLPSGAEARRTARICSAHEATRKRRVKSALNTYLRQDPAAAARLARQLKPIPAARVEMSAEEFAAALSQTGAESLPSFHRDLLTEIVFRTSAQQKRPFSSRELRNGFVRPVAVSIRDLGPAIAQRCLQQILATRQMPNQFERYYAVACANELRRAQALRPHQ